MAKRKVKKRTVKYLRHVLKLTFLLICLFFPSQFPLPLICSSVHLCTASLHGSVTCTCHCWTDCMSTTPRSSPVASSFVRTTAPMKLSSSRCEPSTPPCVESVGVKTERMEMEDVCVGGGEVRKRREYRIAIEEKS